MTFMEFLNEPVSFRTVWVLLAVVISAEVVLLAAMIWSIML